LATTEVAGATTNLAFLRRLVGHGRFASGDVDTGLIEADLDALVAAPDARRRGRAGSARGDGARWRSRASAGFSLWAPLRQSVRLMQGESATDVVVEPLGPDHARCVIGEAVVEIARVDAGWRPEGGGPILRAVALPGRVVVYDGDAHVFAVPDPLAIAAEAGGGGNRIEAPMPGLVKAVFVAAGQAVAKGARLAVLEAMKMEHVLTAGRDGVVGEVLVGEGTQVEAGAPLILLEAGEDAA
jgi:3-methylcrotonyl-CoA carboxylase alpha subunit